MTAALATPSMSRRGAATAGTWPLIRFIMRRDRVRLPVWIVSIAVVVASAASGYQRRYPTQQDLDQIAKTLQLPATVALAGPYHSGAGLTYGALTAQALVGLTSMAVALMALLTVVRHTRAEEESGRAELLRAGVVGRHAQLAAALAVAGGSSIAVGAAAAAALAANRIPSIDGSGALLFGAALAAVGLVFAGVAAVAVQLNGYSRAAAGTTGAVLGAAYALRAIGDVGDGTVSWLSPIGWAQATKVFVEDRWWPLLPAAALAAVLVAVATWLSAHRDLGAGMVPPRPGAPTASRALGTLVGLAVRLQRVSMVAWAVAMLVFGVAYGSILGDAEDLFAEIPSLQDLVVDGSSISDSLAATMLLVMAIVVAVQGVLAVLKLRGEEASGRAEVVLATSVSRTRWAGSHLAVAFTGTTLSLLAGGLGFGIGAALTLDDAGMISTMVGSALAYLPAVWVTVGFAMAAAGLAPRIAPIAWVPVAYGFGVFYAGTYLDTPGWLDSASPFAHIPLVPAQDLRVVPVLALTAVAIGLTAAGLAGLRHRNLPVT